MSIQETYEKFKHLDGVLSHPVEGEPISKVARDLWLAIKETAQQSERSNKVTLDPRMQINKENLHRLLGEYTKERPWSFYSSLSQWADFISWLDDSYCDCEVPMPNPNEYNPHCLSCGKRIQ